MGSQFEKLLIVIPPARCTMEAAAEHIKTRSPGIETLLFDSSGLSCTFFCVDNSSMMKNIFPKRPDLRKNVPRARELFTK